MEPNTTSQTAPVGKQETNRMGCLLAVLFAGTVLWVLSISASTLLLEWLNEQAVFEGSLGAPDLRWLLALGYGLFIFVPLLIETAFIKPRRQNAQYRTLLLASVLSFTMIPARLLPIQAALEVAIFQAGGLVVYLLVLFQWMRKERPEVIKDGLKKPLDGIWLALGLGLVLGLPWAVWGALGSIWDIVLNLIVGLLFGVAASLTLEASLYSFSPQRRVVNSIGWEWVFTALTLIIMAIGVGQTGTQILIAILMVLISFLVVITSRYQLVSGENRWLAVSLLVGLATSWALIWVDPDEMMLEISSSQGELLTYVTRILLVEAGILLVLSLIGWMARKPIEQNLLNTSLKWVAIILSTGALGFTYFAAGQPGFYGEKLFVVMADQADLEGLDQIDDPMERRAAVYQRLVEHADRSQQALKAELNRRGIEYTPYYLLNGMEVNGGLFIRLWLNSRADVDRVLDSPHLRPLPEALTINRGVEPIPEDTPWPNKLIQADRVWEELNVRGEGIVIGQADSGVQADHPELRNGYLGKDGDDNYHWFDPWSGTTKPVDYHGHGTGTLSVAVGDRLGVAPDAQWIGCVALQRNLGNPAYYLNCLQFLFAPYPQNGDSFMDGKPELGANIINNSWGCPAVEGCDPQIFWTSAHALRTSGVFVTASTGNSGYAGCGSVKNPLAIYDQVYSVGSISQAGELSEFSSLGPVVVDDSYRIKPDILAPGEDILVAAPESSYTMVSGTSFAAPYISGVVALMWSANPKLIGDIDQTEQILQNTANMYQGKVPNCSSELTIPLNGIGYGIVNAYEAVKMSLTVISP